ncbi:filamentous hemagglutinin N-terminal domain-containing protein [Pseudorhodobacter sp. E13]|uniref:two-partner secretion domain-containing protein n=1 Tax=Pseudorhodobacter sp. E13 TaxID=2487931 RepID=UPI000F8CC784|nr:filamentous hemagglutinin N-terminal domain-containing protein [Pseudorhodobacter sp. E13]RUS65183.1 filamentous hemagglutinin N-terminal domain-containing protein [Pseudorhodobacter sp. E13]
MYLVSRHSFLRTTTALTSAGALVLGLSLPTNANPSDGQVVAGEATISTPTPSTLLINQHSQNVVLEWGSFNIDAGETTTFVQPNVDAWALNRVVGSQDPSVIAGALNANGNIAIVNPDGIVFSRGARVDVGGLVATTADIDNNAFMRGELRFSLPGNPTASVINEGTVSVRDHGLAAFVAPGVRNSGVITARFGTVSLASGNTFALDLYGDGLVSLAIGDEITEDVIDVATGAVMADLVKNEGTISANGGTVALTAATARTAVNSVINNTGVIEANSVGMRNGKIILGAQTASSRAPAAPRQTVRVSGTLSAAAPARSLRPTARPGSGGTIQITGEDIQITGATIDASGSEGGGTVLIGGDYLGGRQIDEMFPIGEDIREDYDVATATTVTVDNPTTINASATEDGDGGKVILWSDQATTTSANILAYGAEHGTGGFIETSSAGVLSLPEGYVSAGQGGTWLLDPEQLYVSNEAAVFGNTEYVDAATVENALNSGTNVTLVSSGADARTGINSQIRKTAGGNARLSLGSSGSVSINADIISTSGELDIVIRTADALEPFINGSLTGFRDGLLIVSDATIETNGGDFGYRGAAFQMTNSVVSSGAEPASDTRPGNIRTNGGVMLFELSALPTGSADASGTIGCNGYYQFDCGQASQVLDAGAGTIVFRQNPNATTTNPDNFPKIYVGDYGIATTGTLTLDGVNLRSERSTNRNSVYNIEFGALSLRNGAIIDFPLQDALGLEAFYTPVAVSGVSLPTGTYRVGERIIIQLPTLFTSPNSPILSLDVFGPSGGSYQIVGNELVIDYNGPPGPINLTFRATTFAGTSTNLMLSLNIQEAVTPPPVDNPPTLVGSIPTLPNAEIGAEYAITTPVLFADDNGVGGLRLGVSGLPAGLTATDNRNGTVTISGTPTTAGAITFTVTATDAGGNEVSTNGRFTVNDIRVVVIRPQDEPGVFVSLGFSSDQREEFENMNSSMSRLCEETAICWSDNVGIFRGAAVGGANVQSLASSREFWAQQLAGLTISGTTEVSTVLALLLTGEIYKGQLRLINSEIADSIGQYFASEVGQKALENQLKGSVTGGIITSAFVGFVADVVADKIGEQFGIPSFEWYSAKSGLAIARIGIATGQGGLIGANIEAASITVEEFVELDRIFRDFARDGGSSGMDRQMEHTLKIASRVSEILAQPGLVEGGDREELISFLVNEVPEAISNYREINDSFPAFVIGLIEG